MSLNNVKIGNYEFARIGLLIITLTVNCGCKRNTDAMEKLMGKVAVIKQIDDLYLHYANDDPMVAGKSLLKSIGILEKSSCFDDTEREELLGIEYSRLAVMTHKLGKKDEEEAYFLSAKYCQLKCFESANIPLQEAIKKVNQMSIESLTIFVEKMDKNNHGGKLANYNQCISNEPVSRAKANDGTK